MLSACKHFAQQLCIICAAVDAAFFILLYRPVWIQNEHVAERVQMNVAHTFVMCVTRLLLQIWFEYKRIGKKAASSLSLSLRSLVLPRGDSDNLHHTRSRAYIYTPRATTHSAVNFHFQTQSQERQCFSTRQAARTIIKRDNISLTGNCFAKYSYWTLNFWL